MCPKLASPPDSFLGKLVLGGLGVGAGPPAVALASAGSSALNYSDEVGHTKAPKAFFNKNKTQVPAPSPWAAEW